MEEHHRVVVHEGWFPLANREVATHGGPGYQIDGSFLPFVVEELVSISACELLVPRHSIPAHFVEHLPAELARYVRVVDSQVAGDRAAGLLQPILHEHGIRHEHGAFVSPADSDLQTTEHAMRLHQQLHSFLIGSILQAGVDFDAKLLASSARWLRARTRNVESRDILANLEGFFGQYVDFQAPSVVMVSTASHSQRQRFFRMLQDHDFHDFSRAVWNLGVSARVRRTTDMLLAMARSLVAKPRYRAVFDVGSTAMSAFEGPSLPRATSLQHLLGDGGYVPPVVGVGAAMKRAVAFWREADPKPIYWD